MGWKESFGPQFGFRSQADHLQDMTQSGNRGPFQFDCVSVGVSVSRSVSSVTVLVRLWALWPGRCEAKG